LPSCRYHTPLSSSQAALLPKQPPSCTTKETLPTSLNSRSSRPKPQALHKPKSVPAAANAGRSQPLPRDSPCTEVHTLHVSVSDRKPITRCHLLLRFARRLHSTLGSKSRCHRHCRSMPNRTATQPAPCLSSPKRGPTDTASNRPKPGCLDASDRPKPFEENLSDRVMLQPRTKVLSLHVTFAPGGRSAEAFRPLR
jgi:hypothetical protein